MRFNKLILILVLFLAIPFVNAQTCHNVDPKCEGHYPSDYACDQHHIVTGFCDNNCYYHPTSGFPTGECYNSGRGNCIADSRCHMYLPYSQGMCPRNYYCDSNCQCATPTTGPHTTTSTTTRPTTTYTTTRYTTIPPQPRGGGGGGRMPLMMETSEGLNNPIVILVALIAIVVIIYGAFKFFAKKK